MIPVHLLSKIDVYHLEVEPGVRVEVHFVDDPGLIDQNISTLTSLLGKQRLVGMDVKISTNTETNQSKSNMIILYVEWRGKNPRRYCLIIQHCHLRSFPKSLKEFLADKTICFVGTGMDTKVKRMRSDTGYAYYSRSELNCNTGVGLGHLAARICKKPDLTTFELTELAALVGIESTAAMMKCPDWTARVFTRNEIKYAIHEAYTCYVIGNKLLNSVDAKTPRRTFPKLCFK